MFISTVHAAGMISQSPPVQLVLLRVLHFFLTIAGSVALVAFVLAGLMYMFASGDRRTAETAKKYLQYCVIGVLVIFGALIVVRYIMSIISANVGA